MFVVRRLILAALAIAATACTGDVFPEAGNRLNLGAHDFQLPIRNSVEQRFQTIVRQHYDFSCGSAALATLLSYHYDLPTVEADTFVGMWNEGDQALIQQQGFSLLDMKRYLAGRGLGANGFRVSLADIRQAATPGIALVTTGTYRHFVVVKGLKDGTLLIGDPALGMRLIDAEEFEAMWNGIFFVIQDDPITSNFNDVAHWDVVPRARATGFTSDPLSTASLRLTAPLRNEL